MNESVLITEDLYNDPVPVEKYPTCLDSAITVYINVKKGDKEGILVHNFKPESWNTWFPYFTPNHKFLVEEYEFPPNLIYGEIVDIYKQEYDKAIDHKDREQKLIAEFEETFGIKDVKLVEMSTVYELKHSLSRGTNTLYRIDNLILERIDDINKLYNQELYPQAIFPYTNPELYEGVKIASNVTELLNDPKQVEILKKYVIEIEDELWWVK